MNENEIARIAAAGNALRPDWPVESLRTLLHRPELANRPRRDVAVALAWVACESDTKTPARVVESGPWWRAANVETPERVVRYPPKRGEDCPRHPGQWAHSCGGCVADRNGIGYDDEPTSPPPAVARPADDASRERGLAQCRAALKEEKA